MRRLTLAVILLFTSSAQAGYQTATFADTGLISGVGQYANDPPNGSFTSGGDTFYNSYNTKYGSWSGFSVSSMTDTTTPGYTNQYSAITGTGNGMDNGQPNVDYGVVYGSAIVNLAGYATSIDLTNTTYAYYSILDGDQFSRQFTLANKDHFDVIITGYSGQNGTGSATGSIDYKLADYTGSSPILLNTWATISLTSLNTAGSLGFSFTSTDTGIYGINTPEYVAVDNLVTSPFSVPEPGSWVLCATSFGLLALVGRRRLARTVHA